MSKRLRIRLTLNEEILGSASANPDIHREYIASKSPDPTTIEDEVAAIGVDKATDKAMTVFPKHDGKPFMYDYQMKGFFKDACGALRAVPDTLSEEQKAYKKIIDGTIFVFPRMIFFAPSGKMGDCQRPLRAETAQGPRIALANSETLPVGTTVEMEILIMNEKTEPLVREWLDYGALRGLGQWRNSGKGRFSWEDITPTEEKAKAK